MRKLDHVLMPFDCLTKAKDRLAGLGFTVADEARHPFGTANACVYFQDETYLEPLSVYDEALISKALQEGNTFVAGFTDYRRQFGDDGISSIALKSVDAEGDHRGFVDAGCSGGEMLTFSRPLKQPDGSVDTASFKLAFSAMASEHGFHLFTCQRINVPNLAGEGMALHENCVIGIRRVILSADHGPSIAHYLSIVMDSEGNKGVAKTAYSLGDASLEVMPPQAIENELGVLIGDTNGGLRARAVAFAVHDVRKAAKLLDARGIEHSMRDDRLIVPDATGQGTTFIFEEERHE
ncbi:MAG: VOC family protein [Gammaproteobacteria bacterium]